MIGESKIQVLKASTTEIMLLMHQYPDIASIVVGLLAAWVECYSRNHRNASSVAKVYFFHDRREFRVAFQEQVYSYDTRNAIQRICQSISKLCHSVEVCTSAASQKSVATFGRTHYAHGSMLSQSTQERRECDDQCVVLVRKAFYRVPVRYTASLEEGDTVVSRVAAAVALSFANNANIELHVLMQRRNNLWLPVLQRERSRTISEGLERALGIPAADWIIFQSKMEIFKVLIETQLAVSISRSTERRRNRIQVIIKKQRLLPPDSLAMARIRTKLPDILRTKNRTDLYHCVSWAAYVHTSHAERHSQQQPSLEDDDHAISLAILNTFQRHIKQILRIFFSGSKQNQRVEAHKEPREASIIPQRSLVFANRHPQSVYHSLTADTVVIGQFDNAAILCFDSSSQCLFALDQHAAAERIRYERFQREFQSIFNVKRLDTPEIMSNIPLALLHNFHKTRQYLAKWGFEATQSDETSLSVMTVPYFAFLDEPKEHIMYFQSQDICSLLEELHSTHLCESDHMPRIFDTKLVLRSCRGALMFGQPRTWVQCQSILADLSKTVHPNACSHGRKSMMKLLHV